MSEPAIAVTDVTIRYPGVVVARDLSFAVESGTVYALLGRNGAGKSSIVRTLSGQAKPASGRATILGYDCWSRRQQLMERVAVVPEEPNLPAGMTAASLHDLCARIYAAWDRATATEILERFDVPPNTEAQRLSRGQMRGLMLSLALGARPVVLILDDPTLGLDPVARKAALREIIGTLADQGVTVLMVGQDLDLAEGLATHIGILHRGVLLLDEPLEELKQRFRRLSFSAALAEPPPGFAVQKSQEHPWGTEAIVSDFEPSKLDRLRDACQPADVEASSVSLEEIFISVTARGGEKGKAA